MGEPFLSEIRMFAGDFAPRGWMFCQGQVLPISANQALFSLLGTTYGGDGRSNFALPDLRGSVPICASSSAPGRTPFRAGQHGGLESVSLGVDQMPAHTHHVSVTTSASLSASTNQATEHIPATDSVLSKAYFSRAQQHFVENYVPGTAGSPGGSGDVALGGVEAHGEMKVQASGGAQTHNNMQPYLVLHYIIAVEGLYPPRE